MNELAQIVDRHCTGEFVPCALDRVMLSRLPSATPPLEWLYEPRMYLVAEGRKRVCTDLEEIVYDPEQYLIVSATSPAKGQVVRGPCLSIALTFDLDVLGDLVRGMPEPSVSKRLQPIQAIRGLPLRDELRDAVLRLVRLLDQPEHIPVLAPLCEREVLYRLLLTDAGDSLRQLVSPDSVLSQIGRAVELIRRRFDEPLSVAELARVAGMSSPSFHRHFRAVTAISPLQFQKRIRLQEAQKRLLAHTDDAKQIAFDVGYESPSQFNREFSRLFGETPGRLAQKHQRKMLDSQSQLSL